VTLTTSTPVTVSQRFELSSVDMQSSPPSSLPASNTEATWSPIPEQTGLPGDLEMRPKDNVLRTVRKHCRAQNTPFLWDSALYHLDASKTVRESIVRIEVRAKELQPYARDVHPRTSSSLESLVDAGLLKLRGGHT
jgi:hypothetical protein